MTEPFYSTPVDCDDKKQLRRFFRRLAHSRSADDALTTGMSLFSLLAISDVFHDARNIMAYCPIYGELAIEPCLKVWHDEGKRIFLPRVAGNDIQPVEVLNTPGSSLNDSLQPSEPYGILEPIGDPVDPTVLDLIIVPALAFDRRGFRLGRGGGFYDRFLPQATAAKSVVVGYDDQLFPALPNDPWDRPCDFFLTPHYSNIEMLQTLINEDSND